MLTRYVTLWPWPLTSWPWTFTAPRVFCVNSTKCERNRIIDWWLIDNFANFCITLCHAVTLTFDLLMLNFYSASGVLCLTLYNIWAKSNNLRLSYWPFSTLCVQFQGVEQNWQRFLRGAWTQLYQTWPGKGRSSQHCIFVSDLWYLAAFSNACGSNLSDVLNDPKFRTFGPPVKIR